MSLPSPKKHGLRLAPQAKAKLAVLAQRTGESPEVVVARALDLLEEQLFWAQMDAGYAAHGRAIAQDLLGCEGGLEDGLNEVPA